MRMIVGEKYYFKDPNDKITEGELYSIINDNRLAFGKEEIPHYVFLVDNNSEFKPVVVAEYSVLKSADAELTKIIRGYKLKANDEIRLYRALTTWFNRHRSG